MTYRIARRSCTLALVAAVLLPAPVLAHPGSGIMVDRVGQVYFVDMVSGIWKIDTRGVLTHIPGPAFHWMTLDAGNRFSRDLRAEHVSTIAQHVSPTTCGSVPGVGPADRPLVRGIDVDAGGTDGSSRVIASVQRSREGH